MEGEGETFGEDLADEALDLMPVGLAVLIGDADDVPFCGAEPVGFAEELALVDVVAEEQELVDGGVKQKDLAAAEVDMLAAGIGGAAGFDGDDFPVGVGVFLHVFGAGRFGCVLGNGGGGDCDGEGCGEKKSFEHVEGNGRGLHGQMVRGGLAERQLRA